MVDVSLCKGALYCWLWNLSIFGGYLFFVILLPLVLNAPKLYRKIIDLVVNFWQFYVTILLKLCGCTIQVTGDAINSEETSIIISNHRTRVDWNFLWPAMYHAVQGKNKKFYSTKFVLKDSIKNIPGPGWVMQLAFYVFITRSWEKDQLIFKNYIDYVADMAYKHVMILFPEGTDLTSDTRYSSDRYAASNGFPKYKHVLHPRTTGFTYLIDEMKKRQCIDAVYDLTLVYPDDCPQNEKELFFQGKFPKKVMAHLVRYPVASLPDTKEGLKEYLEQRWLEKEKTIEEFRRTGRFLHGKILNQSLPLTISYWTLVFWLIVPLFEFYLLNSDWMLFRFVILHTILLVSLQWMPIGAQSFDMLFFNCKNAIFRQKSAPG